MIRKFTNRLTSLRLVDRRKFAASDAVNENFDLLMDSLLHTVSPTLSSAAQLKQDVVALVVNGFRKGGFFVEFGAANGVHLSNTVLLEKGFGWNGILAEPARVWHDEIAMSRAARLDKRCVWATSGSTLEFIEARDAELSTVSRYRSADLHSQKREGGKKYPVDSVSLNDLLLDNSAPTVIDYLSMDTEGSEFDILKGFDFSKHRFNFISCEHNFSPMRGALVELLSSKGYAQILKQFSRWDDWFVPVNSEFLERRRGFGT